MMNVLGGLCVCVLLRNPPNNPQTHQKPAILHQSSDRIILRQNTDAIIDNKDF